MQIASVFGMAESHVSASFREVRPPHLDLPGVFLMEKSPVLEPKVAID